MNYPGFTYLRANKTVMNSDWKTAVAQKQPLIEKGSCVKFLGVYNNYYGIFLEVEANGRHYYVEPQNLDGNYLIEIEKKWDIESCKQFVYYLDRFGKHYVDKGDGKLCCITN